MTNLIKTRIELQVGLITMAFIMLLLTGILSVSQAFATSETLHETDCGHVVTDSDIAECFGDIQPSQIGVK